MAIQNQFNTVSNRIYKEQLITIEDLNQFRIQLLNDMKQLLLSNSNNLNQNKKWLKTNEVCELLGVSSSTLNKLRINGTLNPKQIGRNMFYSNEEISKILNQ